MPAFFPQYLCPTAQSLALFFERPLGVGWCFLHKQQMGKSSFIREERATVYYLNIAFLLVGAWTTDVKSSSSCLNICKLAWNEYFLVVNTDELNYKFYLHVAVVTEFPEGFSSKWCQLLIKKSL